MWRAAGRGPRRGGNCRLGDLALLLLLLLVAGDLDLIMGVFLRLLTVDCRAFALLVTRVLAEEEEDFADAVE